MSWHQCVAQECIESLCGQWPIEQSYVATMQGVCRSVDSHKRLFFLIASAVAPELRPALRSEMMAMLSTLGGEVDTIAPHLAGENHRQNQYQDLCPPDIEFQATRCGNLTCSRRTYD